MRAPVDAARVDYAGVPHRLVAYAIDIGIVIAASMAVTTVVAVLVLGGPWWTAPWSDPVARSQPGLGERYLAYSILTNVVGSAIELGYFLASWTRGTGATPGMRILRLRLARSADDGLLGRGAAVRRWLVMGTWLGVLTLVPAFGDLLFAAWAAYLVMLVASTLLSEERRGLHDRAGGSVVLEPAPRTGHPLAVGCLALVVLWAGLMSALILITVGQG